MRPSKDCARATIATMKYELRATAISCYAARLCVVLARALLGPLVALAWPLYSCIPSARLLCC